MNEIEKLTSYIGLKKVPNSFYNCYEDSIKFKEKNINILNDQSINNAIQFYQLSSERDFIEQCLENISRIKNNKSLDEMFYLLYYILFIDRTEQIKDVWNFEITEKMFKENENFMIPVLVLLSGYNIHMENMKKKKFDKKQEEYHIKAVHDSCLNDRIKFGIKGIRFSQMVWGAYFINVRIVQVGRLQYEISEFKDNYNIKNIMLEKGEKCVKIHIPSGSKLKEEEVKKSLLESKEIIQKYFNIDLNTTKYTCCSWLLSPELRMFLEKDSNIIKFQNMFKIIEIREGKKEFYNFLYNIGIKDIKDIKDIELPEKTSLQINVKKYLLSGGSLHEGYGILK